MILIVNRQNEYKDTYKRLALKLDEMNVNVEKEEFILKSPSMAIRKIMYENLNDLEGVSRVKEL